MKKLSFLNPGEHPVELNTAASMISYISKIEQESAQFYEKWSTESEAFMDLFLSYVKENRKNEKHIKRTYYSVVSDALETGFSFKGEYEDVHVPSLDRGVPNREILDASIELEKRIQAFYRKAAESSKSLLADLPRAMKKIAELREDRVARLQSLIDFCS